MSYSWQYALIALFLAWLCGSVSSAVLVCKGMGLPDPRTKGSGNPGATNVLRIGGKMAAGLTLLGDVLKGWLPVIFAKLAHFDPVTATLVGLSAFFGHLYPVFFRFKGGKGVATAFGSLSALSWPLGGALVATWLFVAVIFRYSSLAALITAGMAPVYAYYLVGLKPAYIVCVMSVFLIMRHASNIRNLLKGHEKKIG